MNEDIPNLTPEMKALLPETIRILSIDEELADQLEDRGIQTIFNLLQTSKEELIALGIKKKQISQILKSLAQRGYT